MANVLIVDDDLLLFETLADAISRMGHHVAGASTLKTGVREALRSSYDVVLLDVRMPDGNGLDAIPVIRETPSAPSVIIMTGFGDPDGAELAIRNGAWDYIEKPASLKEMTLPLIRALEYMEEKKARLSAEAARDVTALKRERIVGRSRPLQHCLELLARAASTDSNLLLTGETGVGKELFAQAVHDNNARASKSFVVVDCSALPATVVESVLFGYEKGAFTGAEKARQGLIQQADGGTLFLDEVGELPLPIQKAFLRVLQERSYRPVGGKEEERSDFRLVAATNRDLDQMVKAGLFRDDLLFRLRSVVIHLPPLRDRSEDIKELTLDYMNRLCERSGTGIKGFSPEFFDALSAYDWPGNVRELLNTLEGVFVSARRHPTIYPAHLPTRIRVEVARSGLRRRSCEVRTGSPGLSAENLPPFREFRKNALEEAVRRYLSELMALCAGDMDDACRISSLSRSRLYGLLKEHGLSSE